MRDAMLEFVQHVEAGHWRWSEEAQRGHNAELDNVRAAIDWAAAAAGTRGLACALFANSRRLWLNHELMNEGIDCGKRLLPLPSDLDVEVEAQFNLALAHLGYQGGPQECFDAALRATELFRRLGDTFRLIDCLIWTVMVATHRGESQHREAALAEAEALIDDDAPARQRAALALAHARHFAYVGDFESAQSWAERQAAIYRQSGLELGELMGLTTAAWYNCALGNVDEAIVSLSRLRSPRFAASTHPTAPALPSRAWQTRTRFVAIGNLRLPLAGRRSRSCNARRQWLRWCRLSRCYTRSSQGRKRSPPC